MIKTTNIAAFLLLFGVMVVMGLQRPLVASAVVLSNQASGGANSKIIVTPIAITDVQKLDFGAFAAPTSGDGTLRIPADESPRVAINLVPLELSSLGFFKVEGDAGLEYRIGAGSAAEVILKRTTGPEEMTAVLEFFSDTRGAVASPDTVATGGTFDGTGKDTLRYGGTLTVLQNQAAGTYTGEFPIILNY